MKKIHWIVALLLVIGIAYLAVSPVITAYQIKVGLETQDSEKLSENIDFPALRQNFKEQLSVVMMQQAFSELETDPLNALVTGVVSKLVDEMVDSFVTPSGLARLFEYGEAASSEAPDEDSTESDERKLSADIRYSYDSISKFSVWIQNDSDDEVRLIIRRTGIDWKLTNIILPWDEILPEYP